MAVSLDEHLLTMRQAAARFGVHKSTCWRWCLRGVAGVKLSVVKIGGKTFTSLEELERFAHATTAARKGQGPKPHSSKQRERQIETAEAELNRLGVGHGGQAAD